MADLRDFTGKNRRFTGTDAIKLPTGSTAERTTPEAGELRFNTTNNLAEYYTGTDWKSIDAPPSLISVEVDGGQVVDSTLGGNASFAITGTNFQTGASVLFVPASGTTITAGTVTVNNSASITALAPYSSFQNADEPYTLRVVNSSGLQAELTDIITVDTAPTFSTAGGSIADIYDSARGSYSIPSIVATDPDGDAITYSVTSGSIPAGLTFNSNGTWSGTPNAVGSDTTSTFTVSAVTAESTITRSFSITVRSPQVQSFTSGSGTFSVPTGVTALQVLAVGGGGCGGRGNINEGGGGGGAGGMVEAPSYPVSPGGSVSWSIGGGSPGSSSTNGGNTSWGNITALGGGFGGNNVEGGPGGSGGGGGGASNPRGPGSATQGPSGGGTGYGNPGGTGSHNSQPGNGRSGGGGGAGGSGGNGSNNGPPGPGRTSNISGSSVEYARGGVGNQVPGPPANVTGSPAPGGSYGWGAQGGNGPGGGTGSGGIVIIRY